MASKIPIPFSSLSEENHLENLIRSFIIIPRQSTYVRDFYNTYAEDWIRDLINYKSLAENNRYDEFTSKIYEPIYKDRLINLYTNGPEVVKTYLNKLRRHHKLKSCPFCGSIMLTTLDHYLPKDVFPAYTICYYNLVPMCQNCQSKKLADVPTNIQRYIHPYFDNFITDIKITLNFKFFNEGIGFELVVENTLPQNEQNIINYHYGKLLNEDYYYSHFMSNWMGYRDRYISGEFTNIYSLYKELTHMEKVSKRNSRTNNDWETIFYRSMKKDYKIFTYLKKMKEMKEESRLKLKDFPNDDLSETLINQINDN